MHISPLCPGQPTSRCNGSFKPSEDNLDLDGLLHVLELMEQQGISISREQIYHLLQECSRKKDLHTSRRICILMEKSGLISVPVLGNHLIRLFSSCGSLQDAIAAYKLSAPSVLTWNALLSAFSMHGEEERVLHMYGKMREEKLRPDVVTILSTLKACNTLQVIEEARFIHDDIVRGCFSTNVPVGNALIDLYAKSRLADDAEWVFRNLPKQTVISYGALIDGYVQNEQSSAAMALFNEMQLQGVVPDKVIFIAVLKACSSLGSIQQGRQIHNQIVSIGLDDHATGNTLISMYSKCGSLVEAQNVFDRLVDHNVVSWGALIAGYVEYGHSSRAFDLFIEMQAKGTQPDKIILLCVLRACYSIKAIEKTRFLSEWTKHSPFRSDPLVLNGLIDAYDICSSLDKVYDDFKNLPFTDIITRGIIIECLSAHGDGYSALLLFNEMLKNSIIPNETLLSAALKACMILGAIIEGRMIHYMVNLLGFAFNIAIDNMLVEMYVKGGSLEDAQRVFDEVPNHSATIWGVIISGCIQHGYYHCALDLFQLMQSEGMKPSELTLVSAIKACGSMKAVGLGMIVHGQVVNMVDEYDKVLGSALVDMYARCLCLEDARRVFDQLRVHDPVLLATMISGYTLHGYAVSALQLFMTLLENDVTLDEVVLLCVVKACASLGFVRQGQLVHDMVVVNGFESDVTVGNTLIDMYAKCRHLACADAVFRGLAHHNLVSWNAVINGHAQYGDFEMVDFYLDCIQQVELVPDHVIFTNILKACSHGGCSAVGCRYFNMMSERYGLVPNTEQYSCMIDLLARAGCFMEAASHIDVMPGCPDFITWVSLLSSCRTYGNINMGRECFAQILKLNPEDASAYVLMFNMLADAQLWDEADKIRGMRKSAFIWKKPGMTWIEIDNNLYKFIVGGKNYLQADEMYFKLDYLNHLLKGAGHWPQLDFVMDSLPEETLEEDVLWEL